jgi:hypothetical protein
MTSSQKHHKLWPNTYGATTDLLLTSDVGFLPNARRSADLKCILSLPTQVGYGLSKLACRKPRLFGPVSNPSRRFPRFSRKPNGTHVPFRTVSDRLYIFNRDGRGNNAEHMGEREANTTNRCCVSLLWASCANLVCEIPANKQTKHIQQSVHLLTKGVDGPNNPYFALNSLMSLGLARITSFAHSFMMSGN